MASHCYLIILLLLLLFADACCCFRSTWHQPMTESECNKCKQKECVRRSLLDSLPHSLSDRFRFERQAQIDRSVLQMWPKVVSIAIDRSNECPSDTRSGMPCDSAKPSTPPTFCITVNKIKTKHSSDYSSRSLGATLVFLFELISGKEGSNLSKD